MMKKRVKSAISLFVALFLVLSIIPLSTIHAKADGVDDFIGRCYKVTLGRDADSDGYAYWRDILVNRKQDGSVVAHGFLFSPEYINKNTSPEQYVKDLYMLFMGREPEQSGYDYWCEKMANGESREQIFAGFANSKEYFDLCNGYGITAGYYSADYDIQQINGVNLFVERMYLTSLDRLGDQGGQNDWVQDLLLGKISGIECARCFVQSPEFINKGLSNEAYLKSLYKAFMGREYDQGGLNYWLDKMNNGYTRDEVFAGFANSPEFERICANYGIIRGDYTATDIGNHGHQAQHVHDYSKKNPTEESCVWEATCTEPAVYYYSCSICGEIEYDVKHTFNYGKPLGHKYNFKCISEECLKNPATCKQASEYYYSCSNCGEIDYKHTFFDGEPADHNWSQIVSSDTLIKEATCTTKAKYRYSCKDCGALSDNDYFEYGEPLGHSWDEGKTIIEPTLTDGGTILYTCKGCGETKEVDVPRENFENAKVGDIVKFGKYEQDGNEANGPENIEWQILSIEDDAVLVISKYILDYMQYYNKSQERTTWRISSVRTWLNDGFYNTAFTKKEQRRIQYTTLKNSNNPRYGTAGGQDTIDSVFCLSLEETEKYFGDYQVYSDTNMWGYNYNLMCEPTQYAINQGLECHIMDEERYDDSFTSNPITGSYNMFFSDIYPKEVIGKKGAHWVLRTPGQYYTNVCYVGDYGSTGCEFFSTATNKIGIRPALYILIDSEYHVQ